VPKKNLFFSNISLGAEINVKICEVCVNSLCVYHEITHLVFINDFTINTLNAYLVSTSLGR
jgi:hypothetical protein